MIKGRLFYWAQALLLVSGLTGAGVSIAHAGDCNSDISDLSNKRQGYIQKLNDLAKSSKGKLDPVASCPALQGLVKAEVNLIKYLESNAAWCNLPADAVGNLKAGNAKSSEFEHKACALAEQAKKMQQQQASGGGIGQEAPKLPAGPL